MSVHTIAANDKSTGMDIRSIVGSLDDIANHTQYPIKSIVRSAVTAYNHFSGRLLFVIDFQGKVSFFMDKAVSSPFSEPLMSTK